MIDLEHEGLAHETGEASSNRKCSPVEFLLRRACTGILYNRLYRRLYPDVPFFTPQAIHRIQKLLSLQSRVFEWGSGASTLWFASQVSELVSVEHDRIWYERGLARLKSRGSLNTQLIYCPPTKESTYDWQSDWPYYAALGHAPRKTDFREYIAQIDKYPENYFQIIAIDGRERVGCLMHALSHLADDGCIIFDDTHRPKYAEAFTLLKDWPRCVHDFGLYQTTLFFPPSGRTRSPCRP